MLTMELEEKRGLIEKINSLYKNIPQLLQVTSLSLSLAVVCVIGGLTRSPFLSSRPRCPPSVARRPTSGSSRELARQIHQFPSSCISLCVVSCVRRVVCGACCKVALLRL